MTNLEIVNLKAGKEVNEIAQGAHVRVVISIGLFNYVSDRLRVSFPAVWQITSLKFEESDDKPANN